MRVLGVDIGRRRLGLAVSDPSGQLARELKVLEAGHTPDASADRVAALVRQGGDDFEDVAAIVVGLPRRLNGEDTDQTMPARQFAARLGAVTGLPVHLQDERLTSREAESRLALTETNWRRRKARIDAVAAAIILQDFLDTRGTGS